MYLSKATVTQVAISTGALVFVCGALLLECTRGRECLRLVCANQLACVRKLRLHFAPLGRLLDASVNGGGVVVRVCTCAFVGLARMHEPPSQTHMKGHHLPRAPCRRKYVRLRAPHVLPGLPPGAR